MLDIREVWEQVSPVVSAQIATVEKAVQAVIAGTLTMELRQEAEWAAHKLTGSLGSFGLRHGSRVARRIEHWLSRGTTLSPGRGKRLARLVEELRLETQLPPLSSTPEMISEAYRFTRQGLLVDLLADALILTDPSGAITFVNREATKLLGRPAHQLVGSHFACCFADPKYAHLVLRTTLRKGTLTDCELTVKTGAGSLVPVSFNLAVVNEQAETSICALGRNISQQKQVEQELREQQAYTRGLIEANMDALVACDPMGIITDVNRRMCELTGRSRYELISSHIKSHFTEPRRMEECTRTALTDGHVTDYELTLRTKSGLERIVSFNATVFTGADGALRGVVGSARDITAQKWMEQEQHLLAEQLRRKNEELKEQNRRVQEANRLKSEFLANMSHELRTPLNSIIGFAELIHDAKAGPVSTTQQEYLHDILASSRHLLHLIDGVLDLSKVEAGKIEIVPEHVHLFRLVDEVTNQLSPLAGQKRISVETYVDPDLRYVTTDPGKLKQVLYNYLSNALKFTPEDGAVTIRVTAGEQRTFRLEVSDTGIGIRPEDIPRLFVEFQQLDAGTGKRYPGTGLGLALTKRIVEAQGGRVGVSSAPGQGSTFYAVMPRGASTHSDRLPHHTPCNQPYVLVVEGDAPFRACLARRLTFAGYRVATAASGAAALQAWRNQRFDAIVLEILLPDMSGYDLLQALGPGLPPAILITDQPNLATMGLASRIPVFRVLVKPIGNSLVAALRDAGFVIATPALAGETDKGDAAYDAEIHPDCG